MLQGQELQEWEWERIDVPTARGPADRVGTDRDRDRDRETGKGKGKDR